MNKTLRKALADKCKDMGLSDKAIDRLAELGGEGLDGDVTEEAIAEKVDSLVPFASAMQAEITRKTRKPQQPSKQEASQSETSNEGAEKQSTDEMPQWAKAFQTQLDNLKAENDKLKAEKALAERSTMIAEKAKALGIPDYLMKRYHMADNADVDKELADFKQDLVSNNLMPKSQAHEPAKTTEAMKADAASWAKSLPDAK